MSRPPVHSPPLALPAACEPALLERFLKAEAMALWAVTILVLTLVGIVTLIGLAVLLPLLGHATWHAYQDLVDTSGLPERD